MILQFQQVDLCAIACEMLGLCPTCHHLPAQANHALKHLLDPLGQVLVLNGLPLQLLLQVVELLAQLLQTLLVSSFLNLLVRKGSLLLNCENFSVLFGDIFI